MEWIVANAANIVITAVLLGCFALAARKVIKDKKRGNSACGCGCSGCVGGQDKTCCGGSEQ